jgi:hypothetical protein
MLLPGYAKEAAALDGVFDGARQPSLLLAASVLGEGS